MREMIIKLWDEACYLTGSNFDCPFKRHQEKNNNYWCDKYDVEIKTEGTMFHRACKKCIEDTNKSGGVR